MANYIIPSNYIPGFESIINLDTTQLDNLTKIIAEIKIGERFDSLINRASNSLKPLSEVEIGNIIRSLVSLVEIFDSSNRDIEKFSTDFSKAYLESKSDATKVEEGKLKANLSKLLSKYDTIRITSKAIDIIQENPVNFRKARIISDIRLVFEDDLESEKKYAVVVHSLKLECYNTDGDVTFFAAMDLDDLKKMRDVIDRAIKKDRIIREGKHVLNIIDLL